MGAGVSIVVPTIGRPSVAALLSALAPDDGVLPLPMEIILVDDRRPDAPPLAVDVPPALAAVTRTVRGRGAGPAAARNTGWRAAGYPWIAFLDDDVVPAPDWFDRLADDLECDDGTVGIQGVVYVPLPADRPPTDWERVTSGLATARWITADMAYRREALAAVGGFDERFPRAFREDIDLAWRLRRSGGRLATGTRRTVHPVRAESAWVSLRNQAGNADDALLRRLYGRQWRRLLEVPPGRRPRHVAVALAGALALAGTGAGTVMDGRAGRAGRTVAAIAGAAWLVGTVEFAAARIAPGPGTAREVARMVATSVLIPPLAVGHWVRGWLRHRSAVPWCPPSTERGR
jgi:glycosyltransferase involved in cell wall biosynthesis